MTEKDLQTQFHAWFADRYPTVLSNGGAIDAVNRTRLGTAMGMGYQKGWPDYTIYDPRYRIVFKRNGTCRVEFVPWLSFEFKTPKGTGVKSAEQLIVRESMTNRGAQFHFCKDLGIAKAIVIKFMKDYLPYHSGGVDLDHVFRTSKLVVEPRSMPILPLRSGKKLKRVNARFLKKVVAAKKKKKAKAKAAKKKKKKTKRRTGVKRKRSKTKKKTTRMKKPARKRRKLR